MSRRDTIIVAVLINAGLLIVLFASALKSSSSDEELVQSPAPIIQESPELVLKKETAPIAGDEVDLALNQFAQNAMAAATPMAQSVLTAASQTPSMNFADDLKAIT